MAGERKPYIGLSTQRRMQEHYQQLRDQINAGFAVDWSGFDHMWERMLYENAGGDRNDPKFVSSYNELTSLIQQNNSMMQTQRRQYTRDLANTLGAADMNIQSQHAMAVSIMNRFRNQDMAATALVEAQNMLSSISDPLERLKVKAVSGRNIQAVSTLLQNYTYSPTQGRLTTELGVANGLVGINDPRRLSEELVGRWNGINRGFGRPAKPQTALDLQQAEAIVNALNSTNVTPLKDNVVKIGGQSIWSSFRPGSNASPYSGHFSINGMDVIQGFQKFMNSGASYLAADLETMGYYDMDPGKRAPGQFFHITEMAFSQFDNVNGAYEHVGGSGLIFAPTKEVNDHFAGLIDALEKNPKIIHSLDDTTQRALFDLTRYDAGAKFTLHSTGAYAGKAEAVIHSNTYEALFTGKITNPNAFLAEALKYTKSMRTGLRSLNTHGAAAQDAVALWDSMMGGLNKEGAYLLTQNGAGFDLPAMQTFAGTVGRTAAMPKNHIDSYLLEQTVYNDPVSMLQRFAGNDAIDYDPNYGPWSLDQRRTAFGWDTGSGHTALYDTGEKGVGGSFARTMNLIAEDIDAGWSGLTIDERPIRRGDTFFAPNGVTNAEGFFDIQVEGSKKGEFKLLSDDYTRQALNADTFYRVGNVYRTDKDKNQYALQLIDDYNEKNIFLVREGENAHGEIAEFIHRNLLSWDLSDQKDRALMESRNLLDKTARRYSGLFGLQQGWTKGYEAAKRMYGNAAVFAANPNASFDEFIKMDGVDFNSMMDENSTEVKRIFNEREAKEFWQMKDRLVSELAVMNPAFQQIDEAFGSTEGLSPSEAAKVNQMKSFALGRASNYLNEVEGAHRLRWDGSQLFDHEKRSLSFTDSLGETGRISFHNMDAATTGVRNYLYRGMDDATKASPELKTRYANERLGMLVRGLQQGLPGKEFTGFRNNLGSLLEEHTELGLTHNPMITGKYIAESLFNSSIEKEYIEVENMKARSIENLETANEMVTRAVRESSGIAGSVTRTEHSVIANMITGSRLEQTLLSLDDVSSTTRKLTGLVPNNMGALQTILNQAVNIPGFSTAVTLTKDLAQANVYLYQNERETAVLQALERGQAPGGVVKMALPLTQANGTINVGNQVLNSRMTYIYDDATGTNRMISSTEKVAYGLQNTLRSRRLQEAIKSGDWSGAQDLIDWRFNYEKLDLAGIKKNVSGGDTMSWANNLSDLLKQSEKQLAPAMIHDYYRKGFLPIEARKTADGIDIDPMGPAFKDFYGKETSYEDAHGVRHLNRYVTFDELTTPYQDALRQLLPGWAEEQGLGHLVASGAKSTRVEEGTLAGIDTRSLYPLGSLTDQKRDNPVQALNSYLFNSDEMARIQAAADKAGVYFNWNDMTQTRTMWELMNEKFNGKDMRNYRMTANVKMVYMNPVQIEERIQQMMTTHKDLLEAEGILVNGKLDPTGVRVPTAYEQQALMASELLDEYKMNQTKFYNIQEALGDGGIVINPEIEKKGKVAFGETLGWIEGDQSRAIVWKQQHDGIIKMTDDLRRYAVSYDEDIHKFYADIEKFTPGGGVHNGSRGYSAEFLEALTGVKGAGGVYSPNVTKHGDYAALMRGKLNLVLDAMDSMDDATLNKTIGAIHGAGLGFTTRHDGNGWTIEDKSYQVFESRLRGEGITPDDIKAANAKIDDLMKVAGVTDVSPRGYHYGIQGLNAAQVSDWSRAVGEEGMYAGERTGVRIGVRELEVLRSKGATDIVDSIYNQMVDAAAKNGKLGEAKGIFQAIQSLAGAEINGAATYGINDFRPLPMVDKMSRVAYDGTILDGRDLQGRLLYDPKTSSAHGFYFKLPDVAENGQKLSFRVDDGRAGTKEIDRIFIPHTILNGVGDKAYVSEMQRAIAGIYQASEKLMRHRELGGATKIEELHATAQNEVNKLMGLFLKHGTGSKGTVFDDVFKLQMPNSASGITKIIAPGSSKELLDDIVYISRKNAEIMGLAETIDKNGFAYGASGRYPTFHEGALNVTKVMISDNVGDNEQFISQGLASLQRADSDGDFNHLLNLGISAEAQDELHRMYQYQQAEVFQQVSMKMKEGSLPITTLEKLRSHQFQEYMKEWNMDFDARNLIGDEGFKANSPGEMAAKTGKAYVGLASDLNSQMRKMVNERYNQLTSRGKDEAVRFVEAFGSGIEQKLTISAKHGGAGAAIAADPRFMHSFGGQLIPSSGAVKFTDALSAAMRGQKGAWDLVMDIDKNMLDGMFAEKYKLGEARSVLEPITNELRGAQNSAYRIGLGSGMRTSRTTGISQIAAFLFGDAEYATQNDIARSLINNLMNGNWLDVENQPLKGPDANYSNAGSGPYNIPNSSRRPKVDIPQSSYREWGLRKTFDNITDAMHGKGGIIGAGIGALALGGLVMSGLTSSEKMLPEDRPHASGDHANPSMPQPQQTVRLQENNAQGMGIRISGRAQGGMDNNHIGSLTGDALSSAGIPANVTVRSQDDTSNMDRDWMSQKFAELIQNGYVEG